MTLRAHEREALERSTLRERYERAYQAANGKTTTLRHRRGYWYIGDGVQAYRASQIADMADELERRAVAESDERRRFERAARELGPGWRVEMQWQGRTGITEPAAVRDYVAITANGRGYCARFSDGVTTQSATGPTPLQALGSCLHNVDLAIKRCQRHLEEARK